MCKRLVYNRVNLCERYALGFDVRSRLSANASKFFARLATGLLVGLDAHIQNCDHHPLILPKLLPKAGFYPLPQVAFDLVRAANE